MMWHYLFHKDAKVEKRKAFIICLITYASIYASTYSLPAFCSEDIQSLLKKAFELKDNKRNEEAIVVFKDILQKDPNNLVAITNLGHLYKRVELWDISLSFYKKAVELDPKDTSIHIFLGDLYKEMRRIREAIAEYLEAVTLDPQDIWARISLASGYRANNEIEKAILEYEKAVQIDPKSLWANRELGYAYKDARRFDDAVKTFKEALEIAQGDILIHQALAHTYKDMKSWKEAELHYKVAIDLSPTSFENYVFIGDLFKEQDRFNEAIGFYQKAIELEPNNAWPRISLGHCYMDAGRKEEALYEYLNAIEVEPSSGWPYITLGDYYQTIGDMKNARLNYERAIELSPDDSDIHLKLAYLYMDLYEIEKAKEEFTLAVEKKPMKWENHYGLARLFIKVGKKDKAEKALEKALSVDYNSPTNLVAVGYGYKDLGNYNKAKTLFKKATNLDPQRSDPHIGMASLFRNEGDIRGAMERYRIAIEVNPDSCSYIGMAYFLKDMGYFYKAEKNFLAAAKLNRENLKELASLYEEDGYHVNRFIGIGGRYEYSEDPVSIDSYVTDAKLLEFSKDSDFKSQIRTCKTHTQTGQITLRFLNFLRQRITCENMKSLDAYESQLTGFQDISSQGIDFNLEHSPIRAPFLKNLVSSLGYKKVYFKGIDDSNPDRNQNEYYLSLLIGPERTKFLGRFNYLRADFLNVDLGMIQKIFYFEIRQSIPSVKFNLSMGYNYEEVDFSSSELKLEKETFILDLWKNIIPKLDGSLRWEFLVAKNSDPRRTIDSVKTKVSSFLSRIEHRLKKNLSLIGKVEHASESEVHKFDNYSLGIEILNTYKVKLPYRYEGKWTSLPNPIRLKIGFKYTNYYNLNSNMNSLFLSFSLPY